MANLAKPTKAQVVWHGMEVGMFIHWSPAVYQGLQYDDRSTPLDRIDLPDYDAAAWVQTAVDMGARYIILVAKHVSGFCVWQTDTTEYSIKNTPFQGGKGDIVADISRECRARGLELGVYICPRDDYHDVGNGGRANDPAKQAEYDAMYRRQLEELLTRYGKMFEIWFDGSSICDVSDLVAKYCPDAAIFQSPLATIRWVGNEDGMAKYPAWNSLPSGKAKTGTATQADSAPDGDAWLPLECDTTTRGNDWFWNKHNHVVLKSLDELVDTYYRSVGRGAVLLLNATPDDRGAIPQADRDRIREFGEEIKRRFASPVAQTSGEGCEYTLELDGTTALDDLLLMEDISLGERTREFYIEGLNGTAWSEVCCGSAIGHKYIINLRGRNLSAEKLRLKITKSAETPVIKTFAAYGYTK